MAQEIREIGSVWMSTQDIPITHFPICNLPTLVRQNGKLICESTNSIYPTASVYFISLSVVHAVLTVARTAEPSISTQRESVCCSTFLARLSEMIIMSDSVFSNNEGKR